MDLMFGQYFAKLRREKVALSLREFCSRHDFDPGNISRLERGKLPPPQSHDVLAKYAHALGLNEGSDEWYQFFDLAAAERGEIPQDLMMNEEVVRKLPVLFRTLRGDRVEETDLRELIELLRRS